MKLLAPYLIVLRLLCVAMIGVGLGGAAFGHRAAPGTDLAAFYAAGGTPSDLCSENGGHLAPQGSVCDACRLVAATCLPPVVDIVSAAEFGDAPVVFPAHPRLTPTPCARGAAHARAPPFLTL